MEELQRRHRQEQKDLQNRVTQKKKSATKKTRKGINDECAELERQLKEQQHNELAAISGVDDSIGLEDDRGNDDHPDDQDLQGVSAGNLMKPSSVSPPVPESSGQMKKPNRQKARLARRAAEQEVAAEQASKEAASLPDLRDEERKSMRDAYIPRGLQEYEIRSDGHCLYAAIADQLQTTRLSRNQNSESNSYIPLPGDYKITRQVAADYISKHQDDFVPFLEEPLDQYVKTIRETGEWGGHLEILALAKAYDVNINVLQGNGKVEKIEGGSDEDHDELWLAYYLHSFGLGEHYNSLRKVG